MAAAKRDRTGFTLVELLVSMGIISTLLAVSLPPLAKARRKARSLKSTCNLRIIGQAGIELAMENGGRFPIPPSWVGTNYINAYCPNVYQSRPQTYRPSSLVTYFGRERIPNAETFFSPEAPRYPTYMEQWYEQGEDYDTTTPGKVDLALGSYCFWMRWVGCRIYKNRRGNPEARPYKGPDNLTRSKEIIASDFAGIDTLSLPKNPHTFGSSAYFKGACSSWETSPPDAPPLWFSKKSFSNIYGSVPDTQDLPKVKLKAVRTDGAVLKYPTHKLMPVVCSQTLSGQIPTLKIVSEQKPTSKTLNGQIPTLKESKYNYGIFFTVRPQ